MTSPLVSVVMAFRGGARTLPRSLAGVLQQTFSDFELLLVDDGTPDFSACAAQIPDDSRIRLIRSAPVGLTSALALGCSEARGHFIARHDNGDFSFPSRLADQVHVLESFPGVGFVAGATEIIGPEAEPLYLSNGSPPARLGRCSNEIRLGELGPSHHGAAMFRRSLYEQVGGYRKPFRLAQDWDLWFRLIERSQFFPLEPIHYQAVLDPLGISLSFPNIQREFGRLAWQGHEQRGSGRPDEECLAKAERLALSVDRMGPRNPARGFYFVGSILAAQGNPKCKIYFLKALQANPLFPRAWVRWLLAQMPGFVTPAR